MKSYRNSERTEKWIKRAFAELMAEKQSIGKITVSELCARADITKTTFYYHYDDVYSVAEEFENELISALNSTLDEIEKEDGGDYSVYIKKVLDFIKTHESDYKMVINATELTYFSSKLKTLFAKRLTKSGIPLGFSEKDDKRAVQVYFLISAAVDTAIEYLKGNLCKSIDTVGEVFVETIEKLKG